MLRALFAGELFAQGRAGAVAGVSNGDFAPLAGGIDRVPAWARSVGAISAVLTDSSLRLASGERLRSWAEGQAIERLLEVVLDAAGPLGTSDAGVAYQELLELRVRRLEAQSVCVKPSRVWVSARDVLEEPPKTRAKWLMARASLPKSSVNRLGPALERARTEADTLAVLETLRAPGTAAMPPSAVVVDAAVDRRRSGSHYTPTSVSRTVVERALEPLLRERTTGPAILELTICDPSMGSGAFLEQAAHFLAERLAAAWRRDHAAPRAANDEELLAEARSAVVRRCLFGVDRDPVAVDLARCTLARLATRTDGTAPDLSAHLRCGDALVGTSTREEDPRLILLSSGLGPTVTRRFDWNREFPEVFDGKDGGFHACLGNPPWVAYAGRAAQPLAPDLFHYYSSTNPAFAGYRTLHGLFVRRAAELLRHGGRLGFVLPTSVADLEGYGPTRRAHDALAEPDPELFDFGDGAFDGVFQPCMALTSTRRSSPVTPPSNPEWRLARTDLDDVGSRLLARLLGLPKVDPALFGERGFQTTGRDLAHLRRLASAEPPFIVPLREGIDIGEFRASRPRCFLDPAGLTGRFRPERDWAAVKVLIRQTARFPIATLSDGAAFRNSILAGFSNEEWPAAALAAYLNSNAVRFFHFARHRDARQGMPQLKIGHLRALPTLRDPSARGALDALGRDLAARNAGFRSEERRDLDRIVFDALAFNPEERALVEKWADAHPLPKPRARAADESARGENPAEE